MTLDEKVLEMIEDIIRSIQECVRIRSVEIKNKDDTPFIH